jgi:plastocyanin
MKKYTYILLIGLVVLGGYYLLVGKEAPVPSYTKQSGEEIVFSNPKKSAHYESNTPAHGSVLASSPINIVIDFNFDLISKSSISITDTNNVEYGVGDILVDDNKLALRREVATLPDGLYTVNYSACWPDGSCHKGYFQFAVDHSLIENYTDMRNQDEVVIRMSDISFTPKDIRVSSGTHITWINDDDLTHYVNTDAHPSHTYHLAHNSKALAKGEEFSIVFDKAGIYPYHCSAHAHSMIGSIVVE